jgi:hypothetical protein
VFHGRNTTALSLTRSIEARVDHTGGTIEKVSHSRCAALLYRDVDRSHELQRSCLKRIRIVAWNHHCSLLARGRFVDVRSRAWRMRFLIKKLSGVFFSIHARPL